MQTGRTPPVTINGEGRLWCCHGCGRGGTAIDALVLGLNLEVGEAMRRLWSQARLVPTAPSPSGSSSPVKPADEPDPPADAADILAAFVAARGWSPWVADRFDLSVVTDQRGHARVRFPFRRGGSTIWWQDRAVGEFEPKFLSPADMAQQLYAMDLASALDGAYEARMCWLVEGVPDVVALAHLPGFELSPPVIGLPGTGYTKLPNLARALAGLAVRLVADGDEAGDGLRRRLTRDLIQAGVHVDQVLLPHGVKDLDDLRRHLDGDDVAFAAALVASLERGLHSVSA